MGELFSGTALGVLVGLLVGLSTEKLAGTVLAGLVALLAAFLGLRDQKAAAPLRPLRMAGFAGGASCALLAGIWLRSHDTLGVDPMARAKLWAEVTGDRAQAGRMVAFELLGLKPAGTEVATETPPGAPLLFAAPGSDCTALRADQFDSPQHRREAFAQKPRWSRFAGAAAALDGTQQAAVLDAAWHFACDPGAR